MKKILFALAAGLIPALACTVELKAQNAEIIASAASQGYKNEKFEAVANPNTLNTVNTKAMKSFTKKYKVFDEKWSLGADCIIASYDLNSVSYFIYFDKKGHWEASLKIYGEDKMPKDIRTEIKREYFDYKILAVQEIESGSDRAQPTYVVNLQGENDYKLIRIRDGDMDVYKEFKKN